jgi:hypothetical protein
MKSLFTAILFLTSLQTFAGDKHICKQIVANSYDDKLTMILTENAGNTYTFELFQTGQGKPILRAEVTTTVEDVIFDFKNKTKKIAGRLYLDELDQTSVRIGKNEYNFDCN